MLDSFPAQRIRDLAREGERKIVIIYGMSHLLDDAQGWTLYSMIKNDVPISRRTLASYNE